MLLVGGANNTPAAPLPIGASPAPDAAPGVGPGMKHGGPGIGNRKNASTAGKGETRAKFTGNTTEMKGHVFQPRNVSKNANQYHDTVEVLRQYVAKEYESGSELMALFLNTPLTPTVTEPSYDHIPMGQTDDNAPKLTTWDSRNSDLLIKQYLEQADQLKDDLHALFYVILGQCDKAIVAKLESIDGYTEQANQGNCLWLLQHIRATMNQFDSGQYPYVALSQARRHFYNLSQGRETVTEYYHSFQTEYDTIGLLHGWPLPDICLDDGVQPSAAGKDDTAIQVAIHQRERSPPVSSWVLIRVVLENCNVIYRITSPG